MTIFIKSLLAGVGRREELCKNPPKCKSCNSKQVQLVAWIRQAEWRCRICKFWWCERL